MGCDVVARRSQDMYVGVTVVVEAMVNTVTPQVLVHALTIQHRLVREITQLLNIAAHYAVSLRAGKRRGQHNGVPPNNGSRPGSPDRPKRERDNASSDRMWDGDEKERDSGEEGTRRVDSSNVLPPVLTPVVSHDTTCEGVAAAASPAAGPTPPNHSESLEQTLARARAAQQKPRYYCSLDFIMEGIQINGAYAPETTKTRKIAQAQPYLSVNTGAFRLKVQRAPPIPPALLINAHDTHGATNDDSLNDGMFNANGEMKNGNVSGGAFFAPSPPKSSGTDSPGAGGAGGGTAGGDTLAMTTGQPALLRWDVHLQGLRLVLNQVTSGGGSGGDGRYKGVHRGGGEVLSGSKPRGNRRWSLDRTCVRWCVECGGGACCSCQPAGVLCSV